jgi:hypothetical protein
MMKSKSKRGSLEVKSLDESPRSFSILLDGPPTSHATLNTNAISDSTISETANADSGTLVESRDLHRPTKLSPSSAVGENVSSSATKLASPSKDIGCTSKNNNNCSPREDDQDPFIDENDGLKSLDKINKPLGDVSYRGDKSKKLSEEPSYQGNSTSQNDHDPLLTSKDVQYDNLDDKSLLNKPKIDIKSPHNNISRDIGRDLFKDDDDDTENNQHVIPSFRDHKEMQPNDDISFGSSNEDFDLKEIVKPIDDISLSSSNEEEEDNISFKNEQERNDILEPKFNLSKELRDKVTFTTISIREYPRIVGDNPACSSGAPISIGWSYNTDKDQEISVDAYEEHREGVRRDISSMKMPKSIRESILKDEWDVSMKDLMMARSETLKIQLQRKETNDRLSRRKKLTRRFSLCIVICNRRNKLDTITIEE